MSMPSNGRFDPYIQIEADAFLPAFYDWRLYKAQLWQESLFDPEAVSSAGARGVAQFMPGTWSDMQRELRIPADVTPHDVRWSIRAGAHYMGRLLSRWSAPRTEMDRAMLAMASYNAGFGNLIKAQRLASNARPYGDIIAQLHHVTGKANARQTSTYVKRILSHWTGSILKPSGQY